MPVNTESTNYHRAVSNKISKKQYFYSVNKQTDELSMNEWMNESVNVWMNESKSTNQSIYN